MTDITAEHLSALVDIVPTPKTLEDAERIARHFAVNCALSFDESVSIELVVGDKIYKTETTVNKN